MNDLNDYDLTKMSLDELVALHNRTDDDTRVTWYRLRSYPTRKLGNFWWCKSWGCVICKEIGRRLGLRV